MGTTFDESLIAEVIIRTGVAPAISGGVVSVDYHSPFHQTGNLAERLWRQFQVHLIHLISSNYWSARSSSQSSMGS